MKLGIIEQTAKAGSTKLSLEKEGQSDCVPLQLLTCRKDRGESCIGRVKDVEWNENPTERCWDNQALFRRMTQFISFQSLY